MTLTWEKIRDEMTRGYSTEGLCLAQVAHVYRPDGGELGWAAWLVMQGSEIPNHFPTATDAMAAAEAALNQ